MSTSLFEQLDTIVENHNLPALFTFLKSLDETQQKELVKPAKKVLKRLQDTPTQTEEYSFAEMLLKRDTICIAAMFCCNAKDFDKFPFINFKERHYEELFKFYTPSWFSDYINEMSRKLESSLEGMSYDWMMDLYKRGILQPDEHLIMMMIQMYIFQEGDGGGYKGGEQKNEKLLKYPETLEKHIWLFFSNPSNIHNRDSYISGSYEMPGWKGAFKWLADEGHIDRERLLKKCLATAHLNFNKNLTGFFVDIFEYQKPTKEELLSLQQDIFSVLDSGKSKPQNAILKHLKKLCTEEKFNVELFIENLPSVLASETKGVVNSGLMIIEKLIKKHADKTVELVQVATNAFCMTDSAIQLRAAKLINKYGSSENDDLKSAIELYADTLSLDAKAELSAYIDGNEELIEEDAVVAKVDVLTEENKVASPNTIDELVFLASKAFENETTYDFDLFISGLIMHQSEITAENIEQFSPALQKAVKVYSMPSSEVDELGCELFLECFKELKGKLNDAGSKSLFPKKQEQALDEVALEDHKVDNNSPVHYIYKSLYLEWLSLFSEGIALPLLSTPTHHPFWIEPTILVERIKQWQKADKQLNHIDLQIAISRTYLKGAEQFVDKVKQEISGEEKDLLCFLFDKSDQPEGEITTPAHWWTVAVTKTPDVQYKQFDDFAYNQLPRRKYIEPVKWDAHIRHDEHKQMNFTTMEYEMKPYTLPELLISNIKGEEKREVLGLTRNVHANDFMLYEHVEFCSYSDKHDFMSITNDEVKRTFSLIPNYPEYLLALFISESMTCGLDYEVNEQKIVHHLMEVMLEYHLPLTGMGHLFVGGAMVSPNKSIRSMAAELFIKNCATGTMSIEKVGFAIGKHLFISMVPVKRFTDLISGDLIDRSVAINKNIQELIEYMIPAMHDEPIKGLKKLLENYNELIIKNKSKSSSLISPKLEIWKNTKSLSKIIKQIMS